MWTYAHAWPVVPRAAWGGVSILASVSSPLEATQAIGRGYVPAMVVPYFDDLARLDSEVQWTPCPAQCGDEHCHSCRLCWQADTLLMRKTGIAFEVHGSTYSKPRAMQVTQELLGFQLPLFSVGL